MSQSPVLEPHTQAFIDALSAERGEEPIYKLSSPLWRQGGHDLARTIFTPRKLAI